MAFFQRRRSPSRRRPLRGLAAGSLCALLVASSLSPVADAQVDIIDYEIDDGQFVGTVAVNGFFAIDVSQFDPRISGEMVVSVDVGGPASMNVSNGVVDGNWSFTGTGGMTGGFSSQGQTVSMLADSVYDSSGTFAGTSEQARIQGTINSTTTAEVLVPGLPAAFNSAAHTSSASDPFDEVLTDVLAGCSQVVARFDRRLSADIENQIPGAVVSIQGIVALYDDVTEAEEEAELADIVSKAAELDTSLGDPLLDLDAALTLLRRVQALQDELAQYSDCPPSKEFFNVLTNVATRLGHRALDAVESEYDVAPETADAFLAAVMPAVLELILATGSDGAGAAETSGTLARAEGMARGAWESQLVAENFDPPTLISLSAISVQMGWDFTSDKGVTATDILLVFGEEA